MISAVLVEIENHDVAFTWSIPAKRCPRFSTNTFLEGHEILAKHLILTQNPSLNECQASRICAGIIPLLGLSKDLNGKCGLTAVQIPTGWDVLEWSMSTPQMSD